jgi:ketosteroid isomerase-like protein
MALGLSDEEVEYLREGYELFAAGDATFMDRWADDAELTIPSTLPAGGTYTGPWEAMEFWTTIGELFERARPEPEEFIRVRDRLIVLGTWRGRSRETGEELATRFLHSIRLPDAEATVVGQRAEAVELFIDSAEILQAIPGYRPG